MRVGKGYGRGNQSPKSCTSHNAATGMSKTDPMRCGSFRLSYGARLVGRLNRLKGDLVRASYDHMTSNAQWIVHQPGERVTLFRTWIVSRLQEHLVGEKALAEWSGYTLRAYQRGVARAYDEVNKRAAVISMADKVQSHKYTGGKLQFVKDVSYRETVSGRVPTLAARTSNDLKAIADYLTTVLSRIMGEAATAGSDPKETAGRMINEINRVADRRIRLVASMDVSRSFNEGKLDAYATLGINEVGVDAEWSSANNRICLSCKDMASATFTTQEARGRLPLHVGCNCMWIATAPPTKITRISGPLAVPIINEGCASCVDSFAKMLEDNKIIPTTLE